MSTLNSLFQDAGDSGLLSPTSVGILTAGDLGADINAALGVSVDDVSSSEVLLIASLLDNSISIGSNASVLIDGSNLVKEALLKSKQADDFFDHTRTFDKPINAFVPLNKAPLLSTSNYTASRGSTPLYEETVKLLAAVIAKTQEFRGNGVPARSISLIVTDGSDNDSSKTAADCKALVEDMLRQECHIVAGMGIGNATYFRRAFREMGIPDEWILTPGNSAHEIRDAFRVVSQSAMRASQGGASFSQAAAGGFS